MNGLTYTRYEVLRTFRNRRFFIFSLGFPLALYFLIAGPNSGDQDFGGSGIPAATYYMVGLAAFGTMMAMLSAGARISGERTAGWNRQLRITPLTTRSYFRAKVITGYLMALTSLVLLYLAGLVLGVRLDPGPWLEMTGLILISLVPFAALGVLIGHMVSEDSIGPVMGGVTSLLAFVSGTWFPIGDSGFLHDIAQVLPSYWLVQASHVGVGGDVWGGTAWAVIAFWTVVLALLARRAYRRDTQRV